MLPEPCLCLVTDSTLVKDDLMERVAAAVRGGVDLVQLRAKDLPGGQLLDLSTGLLQALDGRAKLIINERADVALVAGADGVQLGERGLPVAAARKALGGQALIGRSVHSLDSAELAERDNASFLVVGTMFASRSHPGEEPAGPKFMAQIAGLCRLPLIGIGGITPDNAAQVIDAGASGVAVITNILAAGDPHAAAVRLKKVLMASWSARASTRR